MNGFKSYHPVVNFTYFLFVILYSVFVMNPICQAISVFCAVVYSLILNGKKAVKFGIFYMLPLLITATLMNPLFNHEGETIITYFKNSNPLTLEALVYGICAAVMIISVIEWFSCFNAIMTSDKITYLFGKGAPAMSLIISMSLRFVPMFTRELKEVIRAQKCIGKSVSDGPFIKRIKCAVSIISIMITRSLENAIDTQDSMKSRGYGLSGRTTFSNYNFSKSDFLALGYIIVLSLYVIIGNCLGAIGFTFFPAIKTEKPGIYAISIFLAYFMILILPVIIEIREERKLKCIKSKI